MKLLILSLIFWAQLALASDVIIEDNLLNTPPIPIGNLESGLWHSATKKYCSLNFSASSITIGMTTIQGYLVTGHGTSDCKKLQPQFYHSVNSNNVILINFNNWKTKDGISTKVCKISPGNGYGTFRQDCESYINGKWILNSDEVYQNSLP